MRTRSLMSALLLLALGACDAQQNDGGGNIALQPGGQDGSIDALIPGGGAGGMGGDPVAAGGAGGGAGGVGGGAGGAGGAGGGAGGAGGVGGGAGGAGGVGGGAGGAGGAGGNPVQAGSLGAPCQADADCDGGLCLTDLPGGYCTQDCADGAGCPAEGSCWSFGDTLSACLLNCQASAECRRADGYICDGDNTCYPGEEVVPPGDGEIGAPCQATADCGAGGACVRDGFPDGYCVQFGCSDASPCPAGSECFQLEGGDTVCLDNCRTADECRGGYACRPDLSVCMPGCTADSCPEGTICTETLLCEEPPCTPNSCPVGTLCSDNGRCVIDIGTPPDGPVAQCPNVPDWRCEGGEANCGQLIQFLPNQGPGYWDYPANGETEANQFRSWARRDAVMLAKYAAAMTECRARAWATGNGGPVCIGDCSEENGAIPGTSVGSPGHPMGTHTNGFDMDMGYFQVNTANNQMRPICDHYEGGREAYHCTGDPTMLDPWRTALYLGFLQHSPQVRVIGVDGQVGGLVDSATDQLCAGGFLDGGACSARTRKVTYEPTDEGRGWFLFHHHHWHISLTTRRNAGLNAGLDAGAACLRADCGDTAWPGAGQGLPRLPNTLERQLHLSTPGRAPITHTWSLDQLDLYQAIERIDADDRGATPTPYPTNRD